MKKRGIMHVYWCVIFKCEKVEQDMTSLNTIFIVFWPIPLKKRSYGELLLYHLCFIFFGGWQDQSLHELHKTQTCNIMLNILNRLNSKSFTFYPYLHSQESNGNTEENRLESECMKTYFHLWLNYFFICVRGNQNITACTNFALLWEVGFKHCQPNSIWST